MDLMRTFPTQVSEAVYDGCVKLKLAHANSYSVLIPDAVFADLDGWKWFQPHYFSACLLNFDDKDAYGQFNVDTDTGARLFIGLTKDRLIRRYIDGSFLYHCRIAGPKKLGKAATGTCVRNADNTFLLQVFHHTSSTAYPKILSSQRFLGSKWNIQGTKRLENVEYVYFTSLPRIRSSNDLKHIAMASDGSIDLLPTNGVPPRDIVRIKVYRESTLNRRKTIQMLVPAEIIAPQHVWRHAPFRYPVYYEVNQTAILRVGLQPGKALPFSNGQVRPSEEDLKHFNYLVLGNADDLTGLVAPYDEEHTPDIFKIERCEGEADFFEFWQRYPNMDHFTCKHVERQQFIRDDVPNL